MLQAIATRHRYRGSQQQQATAPPQKPRARSPVVEGEVLTVRVEALTSHGHGLARVGESRWVLLIFRALPGELAEVRVIRNFRNRSEACLLRVLEESPDREAPRCPLFDVCSACQYQHLRYEEQLTWKRRHARDALHKLAGLALEEVEARLDATVPSPKRYHWRTKLTPHVSRSKGRGASEGDFAIGYLAEEWGSERDRSGRRWKDMIDVPQCPIAVEAINAALPGVRGAARAEGARPGAELLLRYTPQDGVVTDAESIVTETVEGAGSFRFQAGGFFQINSSILPSLVDHVLRMARGGGSSGEGDGDAPCSYLVDLYCGVGLFAIAASASFPGGIVGIETAASAVRLAKGNAALNKADHVSFIARDAGVGMREVPYPPSETALIVDPPRGGLSPEAAQAILGYGPRHIVYVSCACDTQARDLRVLLGRGYKLSRATPFDLFPQSRHFEVVAVLHREASPQ